MGAGGHISREGDKYSSRQRKPREVKCVDGDDYGVECQVRERVLGEIPMFPGVMGRVDSQGSIFGDVSRNSVSLWGDCSRLVWLFDCT